MYVTRRPTLCSNFVAATAIGLESRPKTQTRSNETKGPVSVWNGP